MTQGWSTAGAPETSGKATGALIAGILSLIMCPIVLSLVAIILGTQARNEIRASGGRIGGEGSAQAGIILGWVSLGLSLVTAILVIVLAAS